MKRKPKSGPAASGVFTFALALAALLSSCASAGLPPQPWTTHEVSGISIQVRPAARSDLVKRFGSPSSVLNPMVDYPSLVSQQRLYVFEVTIESPEYRVELVTRQTELAFEDFRGGFLSPAKARALDARGLQEAWMAYIAGTSQIVEMEQKTRKALPGNLLARPGAPASGYLVFLHNFPKSGTAVLSLFLRASNGDTGVVPLRVEIPEPGRKSTGIFARQEPAPAPPEAGIFGAPPEEKAP